MGMFDTIKVSSELAKVLQLNCSSCGKQLTDLQTKDFSCNMDDYHLKLDESDCLRLYKLDRPDKAVWWRDYNDEELAESKAKAEKLGWGLPPVTGEWLPGAWLPENRKNRFMGEWPHGTIDAYDWCEDCKELTTFDLTFVDGVCTSIVDWENRVGSDNE